MHKANTQEPVAINTTDMLSDMSSPDITHASSLTSTQPASHVSMECAATSTPPSESTVETVMAQLPNDMDEKELKFAKAIAIMHENYFQRFKHENDKIQEALHHEIANHQETRTMHAKQMEINALLETKVSSLEKKVDFLNNKLLDNEIYSKRKNLIISGVTEMHGETNHTLRAWFATLVDRLKAPMPTVTAIHRLKKQQQG